MAKRVPERNGKSSLALVKFTGHGSVMAAGRFLSKLSQDKVFIVPMYLIGKLITKQVKLSSYKRILLRLFE